MSPLATQSAGSGGASLRYAVSGSWFLVSGWAILLAILLRNLDEEGTAISGGGDGGGQARPVAR